MSTQPIGIFDSGVGGLTVAYGIADHLPSENLIYYGDTAHMPYGEKSEAAIQQYSLHICDFLLRQQCKAIVIACNTASAVAYNAVLQHVPKNIPVFNVIDPVVGSVVAQNLHKVGIIATKRTTESLVYPNKLKTLQPNLQVFAKATPALAAIIEEGMFENKKTMMAIIEYYLSDVSFADIEGLILACTHYPIIKNDIFNYYLRPIHIFDSTLIVAQQVKKLLLESNLIAPPNNIPSYHFYVSDFTQNFAKAANLFFGNNISLELYK